MAEKSRILVVDDSKVVRKAFSRILGTEYDLVEADDGESAWEIIKEDSEICAIFTDLNMPRLNGIDLIKRMRASDDPELKELPVLLVTAAGEGEETTKEAIKAGANDYVLKPFDTVFLQSKARAFVKPRDRGLSDNKLASLDPLTKLANKTYFFERGVQEISAANRHKSELALILIQIDAFKELDQKAEDKIVAGIIRKLGTYISSEVRLEDTVARLERDRFALMMTEAGMAAAAEMAERMRDKVEQKVIRHQQRSYHITVSIGISALPPEINRSIDMMMMDADRNLREAVKQGGNCVLPKPDGAKKKEKVPLTSSLDEALGMLQRRNDKMSAEQAEASLRQLLPLLQYCDQLLKLGMADALQALQKKYNQTAK